MVSEERAHPERLSTVAMCSGDRFKPGARAHEMPAVVVGRWSLVVGHWSLVIGRWSLVIGRWSLVVGRCSLVASTTTND